MHRNAPIARLCVACLLICVAAPLYAELFTLHPRRFKVGPNPSAIAIADLNDDGMPDLVTADRGELTDLRDERPGNDELSLLLAQNDREYIKLHPSLKTGFGPYALAIANIDALKWPDIIVANFHESRARDISLFLNLQEEGIFKPVSFTIASESIGYYRQLDGEGEPIFHAPGLTAIAIRDINGDSFRDLFAVGWASDVIVYMPGKNDGYFGEPIYFPSPGAPVDIQIARVNKDSHADLVVANSASGEIGLWKGDGAGQFEEVQRFSTRGQLPRRIAVADMNGDEHQDIVVAHRHTDDSIVIFFGDGNFNYALSQEEVLGKDRNLLEHEIWDIAVADFNADGLPDIAAACFASATVQVLVASRTAGGTLSYARERYTFKEGRPRALAAQDLNGDGKTDLAVTLWETDEVALLYNKSK